MHRRKQRFATIFLVLAFIATVAYYYIWLSEVRHSAESPGNQLAITTVDRNQSRILSFGDEDRQYRFFSPQSLQRYLTVVNGDPNDQTQKLANWTPTFVTAASENHFQEVRGMVHSVQSKYPDARFVVYDLGLTNEQRSEIRRWCNARYKSFDFKRYPQHVKNLLNYAWKPLIIAEQLKELGTFFWSDASPRLICQDLSIFPRAVLNGSVEPFLMFRHAGHSIFAATHPGMLAYFPTADVEMLKVGMKHATAMFISDSLYTRVLLKRVLLCALTKDCIAPDGSRLSCRPTDWFKHYATYANCHRYDQSAFALARLHLLYLRGYYNLFDGNGHSPELFASEGNASHVSAEHLRTLSTEWERRYETFASCFVLLRGHKYERTIPPCNESSTVQ